MLERKVPVPLYHQLELYLRAAIEEGRYAPGTRLPTEAALQRRFEVSRVTVRTALKRLEEDGLVTSRRGSGTFVTRQAATTQIERHSDRLFGFEEDLLRQAGSPEIAVLSVETYSAPPRIAKLLELDAGAHTLHVRRAGSVAGEPLWLESRWLHAEFADKLLDNDLASVSLTALYERRFGVSIEYSTLRISAGAATREQARILQIESGEPVLINDYAVYGAGRPIDATRSTFRGDRYAFAFEVHAPDFVSRGSSLGAISGSGMVSLIHKEATP